MRRRMGRWANVVVAAAATGSLVYLAAFGAGPLPPLGAAFNPGTGVWASARDAMLPGDTALRLPGLVQPVQVRFDEAGTAYIDARTDHDLFLAMGYLHAKNRLFQMDLMRRQGEGRLSEIVGAKALPSDELELQLGLVRTAEREWNQMKPDDPARMALLAYTDGVNACIREERARGTLPMMFKLLGYEPAPWTPVDTLVIQGDMTQTLDFTTTPLDYALLVQSLGYDRTMAWFPVLPPNAQHPYDPGPYRKDPPAPMEPSLTATPASLSKEAFAPSPSAGAGPRATPGMEDSAAAAADATSRGAAAMTTAILDVLGRLKDLPAGAIHHGSNSNNWAVDGTRTASGKPMLAGDPHLNQTLPAIWYQVAARSPSYDFSGVSIPGTPVVLIGKNQHIAWSLTNVQNQATFFYEEKTDSAHPHQYYWKGAWRDMQKIEYDIPVKGRAPEHLTVWMTVHGPVMTTKGQTLSVDWIGALPSPDMQVLLGVLRAQNWTQFRDALQNWHAPSQNFVYADDAGNIGLISAGYYPIIPNGDPWLPLPGTGESDIVGTIPFDDIPQVFNPPTHIVFSANQREVGPDYPYYIGTTLDFFDAGYRASQIHDALEKGRMLTMRDFEALQNDTHDLLAQRVVPKLLQALDGQALSAQERAARNLLSTWDGDMAVNSAAASVWWTFWNRYLTDTFQPWWDALHVPVEQDPDLRVGPGLTSLNQDLEAWTLFDPNNPAFTAPGRAPRTAKDVMRQAFSEAVADLSKQLGGQPADWTWGRLHARQFPSLAQIPALGYGPRPSGGDRWTVDAASGGLVSKAGPSWRFIVDWGAGAEGVYPGGQSENPASPWYDDGIPLWWDGRYRPVWRVEDAAPSGQAGSHPVVRATWTLTP
ncbi:penicillin acylase family protein [Alicyclobacillus sp.]|uniref:penicillin acylase family protein n=1 Tax=Alicyclobacillus sp. TaxID=61169 RepID=UPI0025BF97CB|nr:penicillin acylase family protein [Alicyclobacillus sp.]MCL6515473.1 penicillin acylase family protein [Alicyclobacillus sp.]